jgi:hypothetical protein
MAGVSSSQLVRSQAHQTGRHLQRSRAGEKFFSVIGTHCLVVPFSANRESNQEETRPLKISNLLILKTSASPKS